MFESRHSDHDLPPSSPQDARAARAQRGHRPRRFYAVLGVPPINSAANAVRAAIVADYKTVSGEKMADTVGQDLEFVQAYRLEERKFLHEEVIKRLERETSIESQTILATAAIYAFLVSTLQVSSLEETRILLKFVWWLPPFIVVIGFARWKVNSNFHSYLGSYIKKCESHIIRLDPSFVGWTNHLDNLAGKQNDWYRTQRIWCVILLVTFAVAMWQTTPLLCSTLSSLWPTAGVGQRGPKP